MLLVLLRLLPLLLLLLLLLPAARQLSWRWSVHRHDRVTLFAAGSTGSAGTCDGAGFLESHDL